MTQAELTEVVAYIIGSFATGYGFGLVITAIRKFGDKI